MQSNLIISLGMVGALSIVRFRTAIKEPKDILFLFWSISTGIILGAMNYGLALIIAIAVSFLMLFLELIPLGKASMFLVEVGLNEYERWLYDSAIMNEIRWKEELLKNPYFVNREKTFSDLTDFIEKRKKYLDQEWIE